MCIDTGRLLVVSFVGKPRGKKTLAKSQSPSLSVCFVCESKVTEWNRLNIFAGIAHIITINLKENSSTAIILIIE